MLGQVEDCKTALERCLSLGVLKESRKEHWMSDAAFHLAHWKGDDVLSQEMRQLIHSKFGGNMELGEMARLTQHSVGNASLAELYMAFLLCL